MTVLRQLLFLAFGLIILAFGVSGSNWDNAEPPRAERVDASRRTQEALDEDMAMHAYSKYASVHKEQHAVFRPYTTHLSEYKHISDLEAEALRLGQQKGILYIGRTRAGKNWTANTLLFDSHPTNGSTRAKDELGGQDCAGFLEARSPRN
ncbi:uncharacterized protein UTRI_10438 [Ustilago trichophora]|uniref:Uncharacterized protein n=1 Tax=Ustilago trichophora TaxID=86804 RepID=A0A5C3ECD2_9BASI|nr:uncharacterized protein UTRI_10438 [Ustilago trichophora]